MFGTGNREEDELLKLLRQGLITPEQLKDMSAGQQAAQELRGGVSDTLTPCDRDWETYSSYLPIDPLT